jgi:hypothetical protein
MNKNIKLLAKARNDLDTAKQEIKKLEMELYSSLDYLNLAKSVEKAQKEIETLTSLVKSDAIAEYETTSEKKLMDGAVTIKVFTDVEVIYNSDDIKGWAMKQAPAMLDLNVKKFEKYAIAAKETNPVPGVTIEESPRPEAQITSDLTKFVEVKTEETVDSNIPF